MVVATIVQDYIHAAARHAVPERLTDGTIAATVPECPGVAAFGADLRECGDNLYARLENWVAKSLAKGQSLPIIDGIDLNSEEARALVSGRRGGSTLAARMVFRNEQEFEAALHECDQTPA